ncbi:MAG: CPBP family intramembrane metalloprotease [Thermoplasmata archaeon]|nr:MAG: CPBP family intramembrane metalloprotease [Thermoplasmata archaeon]
MESENIIAQEKPEQLVVVEPGVGTQEQMMKDPKWNGIPPVGNRPIDDKWKFLLMILAIFIVKIIIWGIYRYSTGTLDIFTNPDSGRENTYWAGIVAKPVLQLAPVFVLWIYLFGEKGLPFRLTRKHLFSSIIFGCILGFVYYFVATGVMIGVFETTGQGTDFHFVAGWDDAGWMLIIAMMFSYMIATGPTEEIFSRGVLQDQTARAFSLKFAIMFSAVLFAAGHLPISILVYHLSFMTIVWYMIILFVMGCFFSILYQWSRNIVFPAIIHGLWDWYLSLYALRGAYSPTFLEDYNVNFGIVDFVSTLITLSIMLPLFYIVYLVWWKHDEPLKEGPLASIVKRIEKIKYTHQIRNYDRGWWPKGNPILVTAAIVGLFCLASIPVAALIGTDDPSKFADRVMGGEEKTVIVYDNGTLSDSGTLDENSGTEVPIEFYDKYIISINLSLTWTDESSSFFQGTNEPDHFTIQLIDPEGEVLGEDEGDSGTLAILWSQSDSEEILYNGTFTVNVELGTAGDDFGPFGLRSNEDTSNDYSLNIEFNSYSLQKGSGDEADVRWRS